MVPEDGYYNISSKEVKLQMNAIVLPENASNKSIVWEVNDTNLASISASGLLIPKKNGSVNVIAKAQDGSGVSGECTINISFEVNTMSVNENKLDIEINPSYIKKGVPVCINLKNHFIYHLRVLNQKGNIILSMNNIHGNYSVNTNYLNKGNYIIMLVYKDDVVYRKFVVL